ncbi:MAG TPA: hypothetical protein VFY75_07140 [Solirubrobacterales bacterium]|nr:hypothetical protein [Solirubrobacterales bacterium]
MGRRSIICLVVASAALSMAASVASAAQLPPPGGFQLPASNGYSLRALSYDGDSRGEHDSVLLFFSRKGSAALYFAQKGVEVTEESIAADLGGLGSVDLHFVPTGKAREEGPSCEPGQSVAVDSGVYEGRIDFEGEEGFTEVHAARARGSAQFVLSLLCGMSIDEGSGGRAPGARLRVHRRGPGGNVAFEAWKNSPTRPAWFEASIEERRGAIAVLRGVSAKAGSSSFEFDVPEQTALVRPPSPFDGTGRFDRAGKKPGRLQGSLSVDFPGRSNVSLGGIRGSLVRFVKNPSHPFLLKARR